MFARVNTVCFEGLEAITVSVEVAISCGLPCFSIVGLADKAVAESRERIRAALNILGFALPAKRIVVNLSPANIQKEGTHYDLAIAVSIFVALEVLPKDEVENYFWLGELSLNGNIVAIPGVLPAAIKANSVNKGIVCPQESCREAAWSGNSSILAFDNLISVVNHFKGTQVVNYLELKPILQNRDEKTDNTLNLKNLIGQKIARRCLEIAAVGGHSLLLIGPPGAGKSLLASMLRTILPPLSPQEAIEIAMIQSIANVGRLALEDLSRPFRAPHHSASVPSIIGGGARIKPGEVSLAHNGVLFLDEIAEFPRNCLDALRQPIENGEVEIARVMSHVKYPAKFQLIAAMNPCKCGYFGERDCSKAPKCAQDYQNKISGPIMDRIDLQCHVASVKASDIYVGLHDNNLQNSNAETSEIVRQRVLIACEIKRIRTTSASDYNLQSDLNVDIKANQTLIFPIEKDVINEFIPIKIHSNGIVQTLVISKESIDLLHKAIDKMNISMRRRDRVLRVAQTIADLRITKEFMESDISNVTQVRHQNNNMSEQLKVSLEHFMQKYHNNVIAIVKSDILEALSYRICDGANSS
jgi:magnesium chelatase family protein